MRFETLRLHSTAPALTETGGVLHVWMAASTKRRGECRACPKHIKMSGRLPGVQIMSAGDIFEAALDRLDGMNPADAIVVGDTPYDAQAAHKVGLPTIGVLCGGFPEDDLREAGCIPVFRDPADMLARYDLMLALIARSIPA